MSVSELKLQEKLTFFRNKLYEDSVVSCREDKQKVLTSWDIVLPMKKYTVCCMSLFYDMREFVYKIAFSSSHCLF